MVMPPDTDLFGIPTIRRSAVFSGRNIRLKLSRWWTDGPRALVIGHNPSDASEDRDDPTSRWWNAWFKQAGFGSYDAMNLYPFVTSDPAECRRKADWSASNDWWARDQLLFVNLPELVLAAKAADQVFVCWGAIAHDNEFIEHVCEQVQSGDAPYPDLWCWGTNLDGSPKHPMARGKHRIPRDQKPIMWRSSKED